MLVNLVPEFLAVRAAPDPVAAYHEYLERHKPVLQSYWHNYVLEPTSPQAEPVIAAALRADRADLERLLEDVDVAATAGSPSCASSTSPVGPTRRRTGWDSRRISCRCGSPTKLRTRCATRHPRAERTCDGWSPTCAATTTTGTPAAGRRCANCW